MTSGSPQSGWTEVNITPARETPLYRILDTLVKGAETWFFLWEPADGEPLGADEVIRLRIITDDKAKLAKRLDLLQSQALILGWYEGSHGRRDEAYIGEESFYGPRIWEKVYLTWHANSELALELSRLADEDRLEKPRSFYWQRQAHLLANQSGFTVTTESGRFPDVRLCLEMAMRYLTITPAADPPDCRMVAEIERYLYRMAP